MEETPTLKTRNPLVPFVLDGHRLLVGDLVIDLALRCISSSHGDRRVELTGNEFVILALLTKQCGRFVSRADLLEAVAGHEHEAHVSIVDTYVKFLRRQIQLASSSVTIDSSPDEGFRLAP